jgi:LmbE family N-acetylglucosaminyl deacetylase
VTTIEGRGTDEATWQAWPAMHSWPELSLGDCRRAVLVAPHPDDEILGAAGILAALVSQGSEVVVVAVTDGEASHPGSSVVQRETLAGVRTQESLAALADLGVTAGARHRLGVPDGEISCVEGGVTARLVDLLQPGDWCFATWRGDGHPDHEAVGRAAAAACAVTGARLLELPIWAWHWATPDDRRVPWSRMQAFPLTEQAMSRKRLALSRFVSQLNPLGPAPADAAILPPHVVVRFHRSCETVLA